MDTYLWTYSIIILSASFLRGQHINEFHYNNEGASQGEFIEVFIPHPQPLNLSDYKLYLYNGADSMYYGSRGLQGLKPPCDHTGCYYIWEQAGAFIQDGPRDGIALVYEDTTPVVVYEFISYQGVLMAKNGPAAGMTSVDIGVSEDKQTPVGWSLQRRPDSTWFAGPSTKGHVNPIELLSFTGQYHKRADQVELIWQTASEHNNDYFAIQKSGDPAYFNTIANIPGAGNSQTIRTYSFQDKEVTSGVAFYRLQQWDFDGSFTFSPVIRVKVEESVPESGHPFIRNQLLQFSNREYRPSMEMYLYNSKGNLLLHRNNIYAGDQILLPPLMPGLIFYIIRSDGRQYSGKLLAGM